MKMIFRACGLLAGLMLCGSTAMAIETKPTITLDLAKKMAAGCFAKAKQENWKMNIAVVNDGTNLIYFEHMDVAFVGSISISQSKAITAAQTSRSRHGSSLNWLTAGTASPPWSLVLPRFLASLRSPGGCRL